MSERSEWDARDQQLLLTAQVMHALKHHEFEQIPGIPVDFAVDGDFPSNRIIAAAPCQIHSFEALGDGSYAHNSSSFFALGRGGLALTAGFAVGQAIGNSRRRAQAAAATMPAWHPIDAGIIYVNQFGFYIRTRDNLLWWPWSCILTGQMVERGRFGMLGQGEGQRHNYIISADVAELVFAMWAVARQPQHPQFLSRIWLLPEWWEKYLEVMGDEAFNFMDDDGRGIGPGDRRS